jgi:hypothetical protein
VILELPSDYYFVLYVGGQISSHFKICISDLHAGARTSLLTAMDSAMLPLPTQTSNTTKAFASAMRATLAAFDGNPQPDLVLMGDVLDLSLSPPKRSCAVFQGFVRELAYQPEGSSPLFSNYYYVPGNHDHSLWSAERFGRDWSLAMRSADKAKWNHTSPAFAAPEDLSQSRLLNKILSDAGINQGTPTFYPNMGLLNADQSRAVMFHHGHFIEPMYKMMSEILTILTGQKHDMDTVEKLEQTNGSWIDFAWSALGDGGILGKEVSIAAQYLLSGGEAHIFQKRIAKTLTSALREKLPLPRTKEIGDALEIISLAMVDVVVGKFSQVERFGFTRHLSPESVEGLRTYLAGPVLHQMHAELEQMPDDVTFVFGHTHKPFEDELVVDGFERPINIYNTGGWVLDTSLFSTVEGAAIIFVDDDLNTASLRLFNMPLNETTPNLRGTMKASVLAANTQSRAPNPMADRLRTAVEQTEAEWASFHEAVRMDLIERQALILKMTREADKTVHAGAGGQS